MNMTIEVKPKPGRPVDVDADLIRAVSIEVLSAYYADHPDKLRERIKAQPDYISNIDKSAVALRCASMARRVVTAEKFVKEGSQTRLSDIAFFIYVNSLEGSKSLLERSLKKQYVVDTFMDRSKIYLPLIPRYLKAIDNVKNGTLTPLSAPPVVFSDDDDDFL